MFTFFLSTVLPIILSTMFMLLISAIFLAMALAPAAQDWLNKYETKQQKGAAPCV